MSQKGTLYLLPVPISDFEPQRYFSPYQFELVQSLEHFIVEDAKTARRMLKFFNYQDLSKAHLSLLNEHTRDGYLSSLLDPLQNGLNLGLMSDAGCPGIADPGAEVVKLAHVAGIKVVPLAGPSSIVLSIMASGFNGQNFAFTGYLPVDASARVKRIRELQVQAIKFRQAQFFIETPYRNQPLFDSLLQTLDAHTLLYVGKNLGAADEEIKVKSVAEWKKGIAPDLHKVPVVFGIYC